MGPDSFWHVVWFEKCSTPPGSTLWPEGVTNSIQARRWNSSIRLIRHHQHARPLYYLLFWKSLVSICNLSSYLLVFRYFRVFRNLHKIKSAMQVVRLSFWLQKCTYLRKLAMFLKGHVLLISTTESGQFETLLLTNFHFMTFLHPISSVGCQIQCEYREPTKNTPVVNSEQIKEILIKEQLSHIKVESLVEITSIIIGRLRAAVSETNHCPPRFLPSFWVGTLEFSHSVHSLGVCKYDSSDPRSILNNEWE